MSEDTLTYVGKVMFVGDVHLKAQNPACRKDNYAETVLRKLSWIYQYCNENHISHIVFLGDFFDAPTVAWSLFTQVMCVLQKMRDGGIHCYAVVGNHDIRYDRLDTLNETSLGVLFLSGMLIRLSENPLLLRSDGTKVLGFDYTQDIPACQKENPSSRSICVAHEYFQCDFSDETLQKEDLEGYGYDTYVFGHDHSPYIPFKSGSWVLYRPGSLSRNSSEMHNRVRIPRVLVYDVVQDDFRFVDVACAKSPDDVIMSSPEDTSISMFDLVESLCSSYSENVTSVREYVNGMELPDDIHSLITKYLDTLGV